MSTVFSTQNQLYLDFSQGNNLDWYPQFSFLFGAFNPPSEVIAVSNNSSMIMEEGDPMLNNSNSLIPDVGDQFYSIDFWTVTFLYPCIYGIISNIMSQIFEQLAVSLNDFENHRTQTIYMNRLILKVFSALS
jgi:hypothetical protein